MCQSALRHSVYTDVSEQHIGPTPSERSRISRKVSTEKIIASSLDCDSVSRVVIKVLVKPPVPSFCCLLPHQHLVFVTQFIPSRSNNGHCHRMAYDAVQMDTEVQRASGVCCRSRISSPSTTDYLLAPLLPAIH